MLRTTLALLITVCPLLSLAGEPLITLTPEQARRSGLVAQALQDIQASQEHGMPAQVVIDPRRIEILAAPLGGTVMAIRVLAGETVKKGQSLGRLQGPPLLSLQREYLEARGQAELTAEARQRDETLYAEGIIARARLRQTQASDRAGTALLNEKRQALRLAGLAEPDLRSGSFSGTVELRAPFDGVVLEAPVQPGQRLEAATLLFKLGRLDALALEIQATADLAAGITPGDPVTVPGCPQPARITSVASQLSGGNQSVLVRARLPQAAGCVRPYQQLQVQVQPSGNHHREGWVLPTAALVRHQGQPWVFVAAPGGYRPVAVRLLDESDQTVRIAPGLPAESVVVVKGGTILKAVWLGLGTPGGH